MMFNIIHHITRGMEMLRKMVMWCGVIALLFAVAIVPSFAQNAAEQAVEEAKKYAGQTINVTWEAGLQAQGIRAVLPEWEEKTGVKVNLVELSFWDLHDKVITEHLAATGAYDALAISYAFMGDFVNAGVLEPIEPWVTKYMPPQDMEDIHPAFKEAFQYYGGKLYALAADGDVFVLYYRKDLFEDETNRKEFSEKHGYELAPPKTWKEFYEIAKFFTDKYAPEIYGAVIQRGMQSYSWFTGEFVGNGGQFFDPETMKPLINSEIGVQTLKEMVQQNEVMPPGVIKWGFMEALAAWLDGKVAMLITWPPIGRWSEGYGVRTKQLSWVPPSKVVGQVGYAPMPNGRSTLAAGFSVGVASQSKNKELAYLFAQWLTSPETSLKLVMLPFTLVDPFRLSHYQSVIYRNAWDNAGEYLDTLYEAARGGVLELNLPGAREYFAALEQAITSAFAGEDPQKALDGAVAKWEEITERFGREKQKEAYAAYLDLQNAMWKLE
jgi:multiple sugar transport system substrate-binding protein